jgi:hypothetical protein
MKLDCVEILRCLVGFPTVSRDSNLALIDWVHNYLADQRIESHLEGLGSRFQAVMNSSMAPIKSGMLAKQGQFCRLMSSDDTILMTIPCAPIARCAAMRVAGLPHPLTTVIPRRASNSPAAPASS